MIADAPAARSLHVALRPRHLRAGVPQSCVECPVALAIIDACLEAGMDLAINCPVMVQPGHCTIRLRNFVLYRAVLPAPARTALIYVDKGWTTKPEPFSFDLTLVRERGPMDA